MSSTNQNSPSDFRSGIIRKQHTNDAFRWFYATTSGRAFCAITLVIGAIGIGLAKAPTSARASGAYRFTPTESMRNGQFERELLNGYEKAGTAPIIVEPIDAPIEDASKIPSILRSTVRFGEHLAVFTMTTSEGRACYTIENLDGDVVGIYNDEETLSNFFPEVDAQELFFQAVKTMRVAD